jgi:hypothetical protein
MMNGLKNWYVGNQDAITWFIIGFLVQTLMLNFSRGEWIWAAITALLIWLNYALRKVRMQ